MDGKIKGLYKSWSIYMKKRSSHSSAWKLNLCIACISENYQWEVYVLVLNQKKNPLENNTKYAEPETRISTNLNIGTEQQHLSNSKASECFGDTIKEQSQNTSSKSW